MRRAADDAAPELSTQTTKMTPVMIVTHSPKGAGNSRAQHDDSPDDRAEDRPIRRATPSARPRPTFPIDIGQRRELDTIAFNARRSPNVADSRNAMNLAIGVIAQRDGARLVFLIAFVPGRTAVDDAVDEQEGQQEDRQHEVVHHQRLHKVDETEELSARHRLMPSSPCVNGVWM
jgi:hypothetical protein